MIRLRSILSSLTIITMMIWGVGHASGAEVKNLLDNAGFENGVAAPWATYGDVTIEVVKKLTGAAVPEDPIEGKYCLSIKVNQKGANFWDSGLQYRDMVFDKGKSYTLAAFLKSQKNMGLEINFKPELAQDPWTGNGE